MTKDTDLHIVINNGADRNNAALTNIAIGIDDSFRFNDCAGVNGSCSADVCTWMNKNRNCIATVLKFLKKFSPELIVSDGKKGIAY